MNPHHSPATTSASMLGDDDLARIREQLPAIHPRAYLNAGTLGPLPQAAIDAIREERAYDAELRQTIDLWDRLTQRQDDARSAASELGGVPVEHVALMHSTHEGLNTALWGSTCRRAITW